MLPVEAYMRMFPWENYKSNYIGDNTNAGNHEKEDSLNDELKVSECHTTLAEYILQYSTYLMVLTIENALLVARRAESGTENITEITTDII